MVKMYIGKRSHATQSVDFSTPSPTAATQNYIFHGKTRSGDIFNECNYEYFSAWRLIASALHGLQMRRGFAVIDGAFSP